VAGKRAAGLSPRLLARVEARPYDGPVYRFIGSRFLASPLSSAGSRLHGGRFNPPDAFEVLYTALGAETALTEREGILLTTPGIRLARGVRTGVLLRIHCRLARVLDLRDGGMRERLGQSLASLLGPWLPWNVGSAEPTEPVPRPLAPSQRLGLAVYESKRFEAILFPSVKDPLGNCLAIFPDRLRHGSRVTVDDPEGMIRAALGIAGR
jgi:RES domain-containing protein